MLAVIALMLLGALVQAPAAEEGGTGQAAWAGCSALTGQEKAEFRAWAYQSGAPLEGVDFLLPERQLRVVTCGPGAGHPLSHFERVELGVRGQIILIDRPEKLVGQVRITSPEVALHYVRLFTSPATAHCMREPNWFEVIPTAAVDRQLVFGRQEYLDPLNYYKAASFRNFGVLSEAEWREERLPNPVVLETADGFLVVRLLFRPDEDGPEEWSTDTAHWVAETVSTDGQIQRKLLGDVKLREVGVQRYPEK